MSAIPFNKFFGGFAALAVGTAGAVESDLGAALVVPAGVAPAAESNFHPDAFFTDNLTRLLKGHFSEKKTALMPRRSQGLSQLWG